MSPHDTAGSEKTDVCCQFWGETAPSAVKECSATPETRQEIKRQRRRSKPAIREDGASHVTSDS